MPLHHRYSRIYAALREYGFSPSKSIEVLIDAKRKQPRAITVVRLACGRLNWI